MAHFRPAMVKRGPGGKDRYVTAVAGDGKGWLDIFAVRGFEIVAAELKFGSNVLTPEQEDWFNAMKDTGYVRARVWYPEDAKEIMETLR